MTNSPSYKHNFHDCIFLDEHANEPCWGTVHLVDVDDICNEYGDVVDEALYYACEGHAEFFPMSLLHPPPGKYIPENSD